MPHGSFGNVTARITVPSLDFIRIRTGLYIQNYESYIGNCFLIHNDESSFTFALSKVY